MEVKDRIETNEHHSIEWGQATWSENDFSIRNRYEKEGGGFNYAGSSEIPWSDFNRMILESIRRGHLSGSELASILKEIANNIENG
ncbi:MAG: hypothetical protein RIG77_17890 [Cyclobacteriaceae bacterium]